MIYTEPSIRPSGSEGTILKTTFFAQFLNSAQVGNFMM